MNGRGLDAFDWLTARPIAHRGLHDVSAGRIENSLSAAEAAIDAGCAIECDVQLSQDGDAVVFHDFALDRLTPLRGAVADRTAAALCALPLGHSADRIPSLTTFLATLAGRTPLVCEIKSAFDDDMRLVDRVIRIVRNYPGPIALKSFDPAVIAHIRERKDPDMARVPLGIVAEATYDHPEWGMLTSAAKQRLSALAHVGDTQPDFLSYHVNDLPHAAAVLFRAACRRPVVTWTVRTPEQRDLATTWADQMVFEGFLP